MKHGLTKKIIGCTAVMLFAAIILIFSSQNSIQSNQLSGSLVEQVKKAGKYVPDEVKDSIEQLVSKWTYGQDKEKSNRANTAKNVDLEKVKKNQKYNSMLRKFAHFIEYFLLAVLFFRLISALKIRHKKAHIITLLFCFLFAAADEFHQSFVPGRKPLLRDVMIDFSGSLTAVIILFCVASAFKRFKGSNKHGIY